MEVKGEGLRKEKMKKPKKEYRMRKVLTFCIDVAVK